MSGLAKSAFKFLKDLEKNNNRDWFEKQKPQYLEYKERLKTIGEEVMAGLNKKDNIEKIKMWRIYRDVRFSKDKTPYKTNFSMGWIRAGKALRGGYHLHLKPGNSFVACGFFSPESKDLLHIRKQIQQDTAPLRKILKSAGIKKTFGGMLGEQVKSSPKGFDKTDPAIDLLRHKQFYFLHELKQAEVMDKNLDKEVVKVCQKVRPFFDYMSDILTSDLNGTPLF